MAIYSHNSDDVTPEMTADDVPSPNVASASTAVFPAWHGFCHTVINSSGTFMTTSGNPIGWLKFDFGAGNTHTVVRYTLSFYEGTIYTRAPKTWTLQGSNNDSDWTVLDTQTNVAAWASSEMRTYSFVNSTAYRYYKLDVTVNQGDSGYLIIGELELFIPQSINADITNPFMTVEGFAGIYSAPSVPMIEVEGLTGIYAEPSIPMPTVIVAGHDNIEHIESSITVPFMTAEIIQAEQIWGTVSIPMMTVEITERETVLGNIEVPMMTAELSTGAHANLDASAPMMTVEGLFSAQCEVTVPAMTVEVEGTVGKVGSFDITVPMLTVNIEGKTEHLGDISVSVPMLQVLSELTGGKIITGAVVAPMIAASLSSYEEITGDIAVTVPIPEAYIIGTAERVACPVLRYDDKPDILGSIAALNPMTEVSIK